ncbi:hypothetical protein PENTCL1PPCAC_24299, partial [Pristionchus entomophagus]
IADFGLSRSLAISPYYTTHKDCFPKAHTAPEAFVLEGALWEVGKVTRASDVWSYGVVLWELYSNVEDPYSEIAASTIFQLLTEEGYRLQPPVDCPTILYSSAAEVCLVKKHKVGKFQGMREIQSHSNIYTYLILQEDRPTFCISECKPRDEKIVNPISLSAEAAGRRYVKSFRTDAYLRVKSELDGSTHMAPGPAGDWDHWYIEDHRNGLIRLKCMSPRSTDNAIPPPDRFLRAKIERFCRVNRYTCGDRQVETGEERGRFLVPAKCSQHMAECASIRISNRRDST